MLLNLFTSNSKKIKAAAGILAGILLFFFINHALQYLYVEECEWERKLWNCFYAYDGQIDNLYLGSSLVYYGLNPAILDEKNGKTNFNLSTSLQSLKESYYLLKEAGKRNDLSCVYLELCYAVSTGSYGELNGTLKNSWRNTDYMKWSLNKMEAFLDCNTTDYYLDATLPYLRYRKYLTDMEHIRTQITRKQEDSYKRFEHNTMKLDPETNSYVGEIYYPKGYLFAQINYTKHCKMRNQASSRLHMAAKSEDYLKKIIEYCQNNKIEIVLFNSPMYDLEVISTEQYDNYREGIAEIADSYKIPYYDFNLAKEEYLPFQDVKYFRDTLHLNAEGSKVFTHFFNQVVSASPEENRQYFYSTYSEKLNMTEPNVYGIWYDKIDTDDNPRMYAVHIASNRENELEYRIVLTPTDGEETVLRQEFSSDKVFYLPENWKGTCEIIWRQTGEEKTHTLNTVFPEA